MPTNQKANTESKLADGFLNQRMSVFPKSVIQRSRELPIASSLYVTAIGYFPDAHGHYRARPKGADEAILIYCLKGRGELHLNNGSFTVEPQTLLIIPPGIPHTYLADAASPWTIFWLHFDGESIGKTLRNFGQNAKNPLSYIPDSQLMHQCFEDIYACQKYHFSDAGILAMSGELIRLLSMIQLNSAQRRDSPQAAENRITASIEFMQKHLDKSLSVKELAVQAGLSVPHYCKLFSGQTDHSPISFFIQLKVRKACDILAHSELTIDEVAQRVGYQDPYYFSRIFKKVQGCSPKAYRTRISPHRGAPK